MKHLLLISLTLLLFWSCKKETQAPGQYIRYKIDGRQVAHEGESITFSNGVSAIRRTAPESSTNAKEILITGRTIGIKDSIYLRILSDSVKTGATYQTGTADRSWVIAFTSSGGYHVNDYPAYSMKIHIDKHEGGWITGTFSGNLGRFASPLVFPPNFEGATFTEGSFRSKVTYQ
jgi:hypothetical protein